MKQFGQFLMGVGLVWMVWAYQLDTSVPGYSMHGTQRFQNLSLMERRRTHLMLGGGTIVVGVLLFGFGSLRRDHELEGSDARVCPHCAEEVRWQARVCKHCGRDLPEADEAEEAASEPEDYSHLLPPDEEIAGAAGQSYRDLRAAAEAAESANTRKSDST